MYVTGNCNSNLQVYAINEQEYEYYWICVIKWMYNVAKLSFCDVDFSNNLEIILGHTRLC